MNVAVETLPSSQKTIAGSVVLGSAMIGHQGDQGREKGPRHHTAEHDHQHRRPAAARGDQDQGREGHQAEHEGAGDQQEGAQAKQQRQGAAEGGARGHADDFRADQRIAEDGLKGGPADGQAAAHQQREQDPRHPHQQDHVLFGSACLDGERDELGGEDLHDMPERHVVPSDGQRQQHDGGEEGGGDGDGHEDWPAPGAGRAVRAAGLPDCPISRRTVSRRYGCCSAAGTGRHAALNC